MRARDLEPYQIVAGVPASFLGDKFSKNITAGLIQSKWWEIHEKSLLALLNILNVQKNF